MHLAVPEPRYSSWNPTFRSRLCGYNLDLKYPETHKYPTITPPLGAFWSSGTGGSRTQLKYSTFVSAFRSRFQTALAKAPANLDRRKRGLAQREWKRDLSTRANGTIDPWYGCDLFDFVIDYALNYTYPWNNNSPLGFDVSMVANFFLYRIPMGFASVFRSIISLQHWMHLLSSKHLSSSMVRGRLLVEPRQPRFSPL